MDPRAGASASVGSSERAEGSSHPYLLQDVSSPLLIQNGDCSDCLYLAISSMDASPQTNRAKAGRNARRSVVTGLSLRLPIFDLFAVRLLLVDVDEVEDVAFDP